MRGSNPAPAGGHLPSRGGRFASSPLEVNPETKNGAHKTGSPKCPTLASTRWFSQKKGETLPFSPRRMRISREHHLPRGFFSRHCPWWHAPVAARTSSKVTAPPCLARTISPLLTPAHQHTNSSSGALQISCVKSMLPLYQHMRNTSGLPSQFSCRIFSMRHGSGSWRGTAQEGAVTDMCFIPDCRLGRQPVPMPSVEAASGTIYERRVATLIATP